MIADLLLLVLVVLPQVQGFASCLALLVFFGVLIQSVIHLIRKAGSFFVVFEPIFVTYLSIGVPLAFVFVSPIVLGLLSYFFINPDIHWPTVSSKLIAALALALILLRRVHFRCKLETSGILKHKAIEQRDSKTSIKQSHFAAAVAIFSATLLIYFALPAFRFLSQFFVIGSCCYAYIFAVPSKTNAFVKTFVFLIFTISVIAFFNGLSIEGAFAANRTALIFPLSVGLIAFLVKQGFEDTRMIEFSIFSKISYLKAILGIFLFILSLYYSSSKFWERYDSQLAAFYSVYFDPTNGLARIDSTSQFYPLNTTNLSLPPFTNLWQWITVFYPRQLFPDKAEYDISVLLWQDKIFPQPMYYEPFLNVTLDIGRLGIGFYSVLLLILLYGFSAGLRNSKSIIFGLYLSFYLVAIVSSLTYFQFVSSMHASLIFLVILTSLLLARKILRSSTRAN